MILQFLAVRQKVLNSDKVLAERNANTPNAVDDSCCTFSVDDDHIYIGKKNASH